MGVVVRAPALLCLRKIAYHSNTILDCRLLRLRVISRLVLTLWLRSLARLHYSLVQGDSRVYPTSCT